MVCGCQISCLLSVYMDLSLTLFSMQLLLYTITITFWIQKYALVNSYVWGAVKKIWDCTYEKKKMCTWFKFRCHLLQSSSFVQSYTLPVVLPCLECPCKSLSPSVLSRAPSWVSLLTSDPNREQIFISVWNLENHNRDPWNASAG